MNFANIKSGLKTHFNELEYQSFHKEMKMLDESKEIHKIIFMRIIEQFYHIH